MRGFERFASVCGCAGVVAANRAGRIRNLRDARGARRGSADRRRISSRTSMRASSDCTSRTARHTHRGDRTDLQGLWKTSSAKSCRTTISLVIDNIGVPQASIWLRRQRHVSSATARFLVSLKPGSSTKRLRRLETAARRLAAAFPQLSFYFQPADIVSQILNFGLPAPIESRCAGYAGSRTTRLRARSRRASNRFPARSMSLRHQVKNAPELHVKVDRTRAKEIGLHQRDVANSVY